MAITKIKVKLTQGDGTPLANHTFNITPVRSNYVWGQLGIAADTVLCFETDLNGEALIELWPLPTAYKLDYVPLQNTNPANYLFYVPAVDEGVVLELQNLLVIFADRADRYVDSSIMEIIKNKNEIITLLEGFPLLPEDLKKAVDSLNKAQEDYENSHAAISLEISLTESELRKTIAELQVEVVTQGIMQQHLLDTMNKILENLRGII